MQEAEMGMEKPRLITHGLIENDKPIVSFGDYPANYFYAANAIVDRLWNLVETYNPDVIVIEEINLGKSRYAQRALEWIHCSFIAKALQGFKGPICYLNSATWRQKLELRLDKQQKKNNALIAKAKKLARETGISIHQAKKNVGVKGKITKKHLAVNFVNDLYGLAFKQNENDIVEAICLGVAFFRGCQVCDGIT